MNSIFLIIKTTPFPPITGFEEHEYAYYKLRSAWRKFRGTVRNLDHFIIPFTVEHIETREIWTLCAEYENKKITLSWKKSWEIDKTLLPISYKCID